MTSGVGERTDTATTLPINGLGAVDCDVHPRSPRREDLMPFLDDYWREIFMSRTIDWLADEWFARDNRLRASLLVPFQHADEAVAEIERHAGNNRFVQVLALAMGEIIGLAESDGPGHYRMIRQGEFVRCPWHGREFDLKTGRSWCDPSRTRVKSYDVAVTDSAQLQEGPYRIDICEVAQEGDYVVVSV